MNPQDYMFQTFRLPKNFKIPDKNVNPKKKLLVYIRENSERLTNKG